MDHGVPSNHLSADCVRCYLAPPPSSPFGAPIHSEPAAVWKLDLHSHHSENPTEFHYSPKPGAGPLRCASLEQSWPSIRSDSHSLHPEAAANQMVSLNHPPRQGEVCLRVSQGQCPFQHLLHTRDTAVAADKKNIQDVFSKALYVSCPVLTHTKVLNHNTRIMSLQTPESPRIFTTQIVLICFLS